LKVERDFVRGFITRWDRLQTVSLYSLYVTSSGSLKLGLVSLCALKCKIVKNTKYLHYHLIRANSASEQEKGRITVKNKGTEKESDFTNIFFIMLRNNTDAFLIP